MAKFVAGTAVEAMEYDFTDYGGTEGIIPEPTTGAVAEFFASIRAMVREAQAMSAHAKNLQVDIEEMSEEEMAQAYNDIDSATAEATNFTVRSAEATAVLCGARRTPNPAWAENEGAPEFLVEGGSPSLEELQRLPMRVLQAFNKWMMEQINPKSEATAPARPQPQDRQRSATSGSRKGRG